jgi:tetratricopeptide (TPR) repeat protein
MSARKTRQENVSRAKAALAASQEAFDIYRRLAQSSTNTFLHNLATCLYNLGKDYKLNRREAALAAAKGTVYICRGLAAVELDVLPDLAKSLHLLCSRLSELDQHEAAVAPCQEAVDIYRRVTETRPDAFLALLASGLGKLGGVYTRVERYADASAAFHEGLEMLVPLVERHPHAFANESRVLLYGYLFAPERAGVARDDALIERVKRALGLAPAASQAVDRGDLDQTQSEEAIDRGDLDQTQSEEDLLSVLVPSEDTVTASQETVDIYRYLTQTQTDAFLPDLARSLYNLGVRLSDLGSNKEALAASQEAVGIYRQLAQTTVIAHNLIRDSRLAGASPGRGGALRMIGFLSGLFVADVQDNRMGGIVVRSARARDSDARANL